MKLTSNLAFHPEDAVELCAADVAKILRLGTSTVFKYYRERKLSGRRVGAFKTSAIKFTTIDLAEFLVKVYLHEPDSALRVARLQVKRLQERKEQSFMDRFNLKSQ
jgi:hypothetical protein